MTDEQLTKLIRALRSGVNGNTTLMQRIVNGEAVQVLSEIEEAERQSKLAQLNQLKEELNVN